MNRGHDKPLRHRVAEPVQVYLDSDDRQILKRLAEQLDLSMSDVLRKALAAFEQSMLTPERHPSLQIIGIAGKAEAPLRYDAAVEHDRFLSELNAGKGTRSGKKRAR